MTSDILHTIQQLEIEARNKGFYWESIHQIIDQITSECQEVKEAWQANDAVHLQEEVGDLLHAAIGLAVFCGVDAETTLKKSAAKFKKRLDHVIQLAANEGYTDMHQLSIKELLIYWDLAKKL